MADIPTPLHPMQDQLSDEEYDKAILLHDSMTFPGDTIIVHFDKYYRIAYTLIKEDDGSYRKENKVSLPYDNDCQENVH